MRFEHDASLLAGEYFADGAGMPGATTLCGWVPSRVNPSAMTRSDKPAWRSPTIPDFEHAVRLTHLIDDVVQSANTGHRLTRQDWPTGDSSYQ
jgi:hypothetical protein